MALPSAPGEHDASQAAAHEGGKLVKHTLHLRARRQHIDVESLPLDAQYALLGIGIAGIGLETDVTRIIDLEVELPNYPLTQEAIENLNAKRRIHEYRAWYVTREEGNMELHITPEQAERDTKAVTA